MTASTTIFSAKRIYTMADHHPIATYVAVRDGRIIGVGDDPSDFNAAGPTEIDTRFSEKILMPGFVEGHSHVLEGHLWRYIYVGFYDRIGPDGKRWPGLKSIDAVIDRLRQYMSEDRSAPVIGWGFDPIFFSERRMISSDLDRVSVERPVIVLHASGHCLNTNSFIVETSGIQASAALDGVVVDENGHPTGELREMAAMFAAFETANAFIFDEMGTGDDLWNFSKIATRAGVTTATELYSPLGDAVVASMRGATEHPDFPLRLVPAKAATFENPDRDIDQLRELKNYSNEKLHFGPIKIMTDGSIQGFTARLANPPYYNGAPNGIWNAAPEQITNAIQLYHKNRVQFHAHTNGDEASALVLSAIRDAMQADEWLDHRHVLQHFQMATPALLDECAALGVCANFFINHIYYWGEQHSTYTLGPDRVQTMNPVGGAEKRGINYAFHSDAPITPLAPLFSAWCAANRQTASGNVLGQDQCISIPQALKAITMGAAYTLKMDHLIGSIEPGKFADFAILGEDPYLGAAETLKDISVDGIVLGGRPYIN